jgi:hypothetical protein
MIKKFSRPEDGRTGKEGNVMATQKHYTRMELKAQYGGVACQCWGEGWAEGDMPDYEFFREGVSLDEALLKLDEAGWAVHINPMKRTDEYRTAYALRGKIIRVDFIDTSDKVIVRSWPVGWTASTPWIKEETFPAGTIDEQTKKYEDAGWTVHRWTNGARAWFGEVLPVRDRGKILSMRNRADTAAIMGGTYRGASNAQFLDLAFDL